MRAVTRVLAVVVAALGLTALPAGCAAQPKAATMDVGESAYGEAFDATIETLRRAGFTIERVDARAGVITTRPKSSAGLAEPWEGDDSRFGQRVESLLHDQRRRVIVTFEPMGQVERVEPARREVREEGVGDLREHAGPVQARVEVRVERLGRPGLQVSTTSVRLNNQAEDPARGDGDVRITAVEQIGDDPWLAGRLARRIERRLQRSDEAAGD